MRQLVRGTPTHRQARRTLPAASSPTMRILISFFPNIRSQTREKCRPMVAVSIGQLAPTTSEWGTNQRPDTKHGARTHTHAARDEKEGCAVM